MLSADEMTLFAASYFDELVSIASHLGVKVVFTSGIKSPFPARKANIIYDFFYAVIEWSARRECSGMLANLKVAAGEGGLHLMLPQEALAFVPDSGLLAAIHAAGGVYALQDLEDTVGISLSFGKGGEANG